LVEMVAEDIRATSVAKVADASDRLGWTADWPAEFPPELAAALPFFDRAARHAGQYLALSNIHRRTKALQLAVEEVATLQRHLLSLPGELAPRLLRVANEWQLLLKAEGASARVRAAEKRDIANPFVFGNPVNEDQASVFTGRQDIVRRVEDS